MRPQNLYYKRYMIKLCFLFVFDNTNLYKDHTVS
nr:MAG TPA: hypothetical protein [Bacteriophage sp.]